jgi:diaminopimelate decarboxylase
MLPFISYEPTSSGDRAALLIDGQSASDIAEQFGTPVYAYSHSAMTSNFKRLEAAFAPVSPLLCYALKASGNLHLLRVMVDLGAGLDVVSGGELERAWLSGVPMSKVVFAGVGKTEREIAAALSGKHSLLDARTRGRHGEPASDRGPVGLFNIESIGECERIERIAAELGVVARGCIRVNPDVDAHTHKYTTTGKSENKFGIDLVHVPGIFDRFRNSRSLRLTGIHVHLGSPIATAAPYIEAIGVVTKLIDTLQSQGTPIEVFNLGGGYGVDYGMGVPESIEQFAGKLVPALVPLHARVIRIVMEPGRSIICHAGVLLSRVQYIKQGRTKRFVIGDAGMHTLIRPALYQAYHFLWPVAPRLNQVPRNLSDPQSCEGLVPCDVVGPICESSDFLAQNRLLPEMEPGELMAVFCAGAYGMSMALNYNDHPRPAEVLVRPTGCTLIRPRQTELELISAELQH